MESETNCKVMLFSFDEDELVFKEIAQSPFNGDGKSSEKHSESSCNEDGESSEKHSQFSCNEDGESSEKHLQSSCNEDGESSEKHSQSSCNEDEESSEQISKCTYSGDLERFGQISESLFNEKESLVHISGTSDEKEKLDQSSELPCDKYEILEQISNTNTPSHTERSKKLYSCHACRKTFLRKFALSSHMRIHKGKRFSCQTCSQTFAQKPYLVRHLKARSSSCYVERLTHKEISALDSCLKRVKPFSCECGKSFAREKNLVKHKEIHDTPIPVKIKETQRTKFLCPHCSKIFTSDIYLQSHMKKHTVSEFEKKQNPCLILTHEEISAHDFRLKGVKSFSCECGKSFVEETNLVKHKEIHNTPIPVKIEETQRIKFPCPHCSKIFTSDNYLKRHMKKHTVAEIEKKQIPCPICGKILANKGSLTGHLIIHSGEKPFLCHECGKAFSSKTSLDSHSKGHRDEKFACEKCDKVYRSKNSLRNHMHAHSARKFSCQQCDKVFTENRVLKSHVQIIHEGVKNFQCSICSKKFYTNFYRREHMRIHTGEKPFQCVDCGRRFTVKKALKRHVTIHKGEKSYRCQVCGRAFNQSGHLKYHLRTHAKNATND